jgi:hypothetical protein
MQIPAKATDTVTVDVPMVKATDTTVHVRVSTPLFLEGV